MNKEFFPAILINKLPRGVEAVLGLDMKSILKGDLFYDDKLSQTGDDLPTVHVNERRIVFNRESFIRAISAWPKNVVMELLITSVPNLRRQAQGRIHITIILRTRNKDADSAGKDAIAKYLSLRALLMANLSEAEFYPIMNRDELIFRLNPFKMTHAVSIQRRRENIQISEPLERKTVTGLAGGGNSEKDLKGEFIGYSYPWQPSFDDWSRMISVMMGQLDPLHLLVRLMPGKLSESSRNVMEDSIRLCELYLKSGKSYQLSLTKRIDALRSALTEQVTSLSANALIMGVFLLAGHEIDESLKAMIGQSITAGPSLKGEESYMSGGFSVVPAGVESALNGRYFSEKAPFSVSETACAFRLPSPPMREVPGLSIRRSRTLLSLLPDLAQHAEDGVDLCRNIHNGMSQPVRLPADDRMRHMFIIGQTGTGKSTLMESMVLQDIRAGHGLAVIDPHGEMVDSIIGKIPHERVDDVILFDFLDRERPLGFNLLEWHTEEERDFVIDEIYETLDKIYVMKETGGPIFETHLRGMLRLLMGSKAKNDYRPTILEFRDCYLHKRFRNWLKSRIDDDRITCDFIAEIERSGGEAHINNVSQYVTSKFGRFVHDATLMNIIGQEETSFNFDEIMAQGKIFLVKLGKGRFGPSVSALLANQLVSHFKHAAMKRGEMRPEQRRDFYLYVDECHNLPASNFAELLAEARKYRMGLVLATQYASQLKGNHPREDLLSAILGNVGCLSIFRVGQEDARLLTQSLYPHFNAVDIIGLPNWQGYCRLQIRNHVITPFSFESVMDETPYDPKVALAVRELSRRKFGCDVETIKKKIEKRQNIWKQNDHESANSETVYN